MNTLILLLASFMLRLGELPSGGQQAAADALSGTWTGWMGPTESNRLSIVVSLGLDPKTGVSGTITGPPSPGRIRAGSFDPRTGALRFEVLVEADKTIVHFEGSIRGDTATGQVRFNEERGIFRITRQSAAGDTRFAAQSASEEAMNAARRGFLEVRGWVARAAELVPEDRYGWRPTASVRSFAQLVAHVADSYLYYCGRAGGREVSWSDAIEQSAATKAAVRQRLSEATDACTRAYAGSGRIGPLMENVAHTNLHYGNMITYLRLLGLVPPSS